MAFSERNFAAVRHRLPGTAKSDAHEEMQTRQDGTGHPYRPPDRLGSDTNAGTRQGTAPGGVPEPVSSGVVFI